MNLPEDQKQFLISYNIDKSNSTLEDAEFLLNSDRLFAAYNRIYYSCFYILTALGISQNFSTSKHAQLISWFNLNYINKNIIDKKFGRFLKKSFEMRNKSDYGVFINPQNDEVRLVLEDAKNFIIEIKNILDKS